MRTNRHRWWFGHLALVLASICTTAQAGELADRDFNPQGYAYSDHRDFYVYVPSTYNSQTPMPMVMVLHGCHQTRDTVLDEFGWDDIAERYRFILVAPDISTNDLFRNPHCWGYWEPKEIHQGQGEVEDLLQIGLQVESEWRIDPNHRHIAGLSSGGFMANAAAVAHNEYWASAGVHSGGGYNESAGSYAAYCSSPREASGRFKSPVAIAAAIRAEMDSDFIIPIMLLHSLNDCSVGYGVESNTMQRGGLTSNRDAWLAINGGALYATSDCSHDGIACGHQKFGNGTRSTLEVVRIVGLIHGTEGGKGHYWSGGKADGQWTRTRGPKAATLLWNFFQRHPRNNCTICPAAPTALTSTDVGKHTVSLTWRANTEDNLNGYYLYRDGSKIQSDPISPARHSDTDLQPATTYAYHVTAINDAGKESPPSSILILTTQGTSDCRSYSGALAEHVAQGRARMEEKCSGWWCWFWPFPKSFTYYASGSDEHLGISGSASVTLYTLDGTIYKTEACNV